MEDHKEEYREVQENFRFIVQDAFDVTSEMSKVIFRKCEFKHFSAIDNSNYKTESLTKIK